MPDHDGLGDCRGSEVFHITPSCDVGSSADMCADSGRYVIGAVTGGILKNSNVYATYFSDLLCCRSQFWNGFTGGLCTWCNGSNYTHTMECPCTIDSCYIMINIVSNILNVASLYITRYVY